MFNSLSLLQTIEIIGLAATTIYHQIASYRDRNPPPPSKLYPTRDRQFRYLQSRGSGDITVIVDASLGGVAADRVRDRIHLDLLKLSTNSEQLLANHSSHFVWIDQPELIINAVASLLKS